MHSKTLVLWAVTGALVAAARPARAEPVDVAPSTYTTRPSVMMGLMQWVVFGGGNVAGQIKLDRWVFEYSHGQALKLDRVPAIGLSGDERQAGVSVEMPWT